MIDCACRPEEPCMHHLGLESAAVWAGARWILRQRFADDVPDAALVAVLDHWVRVGLVIHNDYHRDGLVARMRSTAGQVRESDPDWC